VLKIIYTGILLKGFLELNDIKDDKQKMMAIAAEM
jgi:hypothetical protein